MNYALLRKYEYYGEGNYLDNLQTQTTATLNRLKLTGCYEVVYYLSDTPANAYFTMSLWYSLEELETSLQYASLLINEHPVRFLEQYIFELISEYRQLESRIAASFFRLVRHPKPVEISERIAVTAEAKKKSVLVPGMIGAWEGRCISDQTLIMNRVDWSSPELMQEYLGDTSSRSLTKSFLLDGSQIEYASYSLKTVVIVRSDKR